jgi:hypothetical protein
MDQKNLATLLDNAFYCSESESSVRVAGKGLLPFQGHI